VLALFTDCWISGGAQNIGKKVKEKEEKREREQQKKQAGQKSGGFRGLKGIM
jgi:hypothetical protein